MSHLVQGSFFALESELKWVWFTLLLTQWGVLRAEGRGSVGTKARAPSPSPRRDHKHQTLVVTFGGGFWMDLSPLFLAGPLLCVFVVVVCFPLRVLG